MTPIDGISYGAFIVPGLIMLTVMTQSVANASFGIYFPKFLGTIYEHLSAPISSFEMVIGYVGAAATKSAGVGCIILAVSFLFVPLKIQHPLLMLALLLATALCFSLLGFILGLWAKDFEQLNLVPALIITPLVFLGGSFYSIDMLPSHWQTVSLFNPAMYVISGFRWAFFGVSDVPITISLLSIAILAIVFCDYLADLRHRIPPEAVVRTSQSPNDTSILRRRLRNHWSVRICSWECSSCLGRSHLSIQVDDR